MESKSEILPFALEIRSGLPVFEQLVYAFKKALISGLIRPGDRFPSVRVVSRELRIHPNTVQKAVTTLVSEGLLEVHPGIGTVIRENLPVSPKEGMKLLADDVERLIVEAKKMGVRFEDLQRFMSEQWNHLSNP